MGIRNCINYSVNEVYQMFLDKFNDCTYIPDQKGNYREIERITIRLKD